MAQKLQCPDCREMLHSFAGHVCRKKGSGGLVAEGATSDLARVGKTERPLAKHQPSKAIPKDKPTEPWERLGSHRVAEPKRKRGRPRIGEEPDQPWVKLGMSERTWYRRQKDAGK